jgi:hypothetical protein
MDFRVYHYGARGVFDGTRPVYGESSGLGWPMHYRYPPLFLLLFAPFAWLPLGPAAAVWVVSKVAVLMSTLAALLRRSPKPAAKQAYVFTFLLITPYIIEEFRYGNAQFFIVALTIAALLILRERPTLAAASLALAISIKVWPAFFLPYLVVRRDWKPVLYTVGFVVILALLPAVYFGFSGNLNLLGQWFTQEAGIQAGDSEIWFPNQSLRGVLMRYLTFVDYSRVPDSNYALVNIAAVSPAVIRSLWMALAAAIYAAFLFIANRRRESNGWLDHGLAFCLLALLQPFTQKYALAVLLWPAVAAAGLLDRQPARVLIYCATIWALIQPLMPGAGAQRLLQVLGADFAMTALLGIAIATACVLEKPVEKPAKV